MTARKRKRAPGAGRKPLGELARSEPLRTKVTPAMALRVAAAAAGIDVTVSAWLLTSIERSLAQEARDDADTRRECEARADLELDA